MEVEGWLQRLGLEQYASAFRDNAIDVEVLPRLTAEDLKDIGVGMVDQRRKLLDAIAALGAGPTKQRRSRACQNAIDRRTLM
jgi:SAM domain (Sterile alpha motif)